MRCAAKGCTAETEKPLCGFHWRLVPKPLQTEWNHRNRSAPAAPLLSRLVAAVERAQFGERRL